MTERSLPILPVAVLFLLVLLTFWLSRFVQTSPNKSDGKMRHDPDLIVERFSAKKLSPTGDVQYQLDAAKMSHYPDDDSSLLDKVLFIAYQPDKPQISARAPTGRLVSGKEVVILEQNVVIDSEAGPRQAAVNMKTPVLTIETEKSLAYSDAGVVLTSANSTVEAKRFKLNTQTRNLSLQAVSGELEKRKR